VPIVQCSFFFRTNTSIPIDLLRAFELRARLAGSLALPTGQSARAAVDRQITISRVKKF
jgi:hypothetical protein